MKKALRFLGGNLGISIIITALIIVFSNTMGEYAWLSLPLLLIILAIAKFLRQHTTIFNRKNDPKLELNEEEEPTSLAKTLTSGRIFRLLGFLTVCYLLLIIPEDRILNSNIPKPHNFFMYNAVSEWGGNSIYTGSFVYKGSFVLILFFLQFTIRKKSLEKLSWKKITENWLKWSGVPAFSVGGLWFISNSKTLSEKLEVKVQAFLSGGETTFLTNCYIITIILTGLSFMFCLIGKSFSQTEESYQPLQWFIPAFAFAWIANLLLYSMLFASILIVFIAHNH